MKTIVFLIVLGAVGLLGWRLYVESTPDFMGDGVGGIEKAAIEPPVIPGFHPKVPNPNTSDLFGEVYDNGIMVIFYDPFPNAGGFTGDMGPDAGPPDPNVPWGHDGHMPGATSP